MAPHQAKHHASAGQVGQTFPGLPLVWIGDKNILGFLLWLLLTPQIVILFSSLWMG